MNFDKATNVKSTRILVTGGNGFIGRHLVARLKATDASLFEIRDRDDCDLRNFEATRFRIQEIDPDIIIHLAASPDAGRDDAKNYTGFYNTISCARNILQSIPHSHKCLFIHTGSYKQYGKKTPIPFSEHYPPLPSNIYGLAKQVVEELVRKYANENPLLRAIYLRIGSVFGPGQPQSAFVQRAINFVLSKDTKELKIADVVCDPIYVSDVIDAICLCIFTSNKAWGQTLNISGGIPYTPSKIFALITTLMNANLDLTQYKKKKNGYCNILGDINRADLLLNWKPRVNLQTGLQLTIDHICSNWHRT